MTSRRAVSRRRVLTAAAVMLPLAATASCEVPEALRRPPGLTASVRTLRASIAAEQALVDSYHGAVRRFPQLSATLNSFLGQHQQHLAQLQGRLIVPPHVRMSPVPSPRPAGSAPALASSAADAVQLLVRAEQLAAAAQLERLMDVPSSLAQLLASIAASEATHAVALSMQAGSG
ncbi:MAG TPA: hypothetical protein VGD68_10585 [Streptosporangiaceae bacterium]